jgi:hypothetical protein
VDVTIECPCPPKADGGSRHPDGDTVTLRDRLDFRSATTIRKAIGLVSDEGAADPAEILAVMSEWYCLLGIEAWTLTDERGKPVPVTRQTIRDHLLESEAAGAQTSVVADAADTLYMQAILLPLLARVSTSSPPGPMEPSTSAPKDSPAKPPKRSRPSSTTSTPTVATVPTTSSRAGVFSTSPSVT